jgi:hypothetical protein
MNAETVIIELASISGTRGFDGIAMTSDAAATSKMALKATFFTHVPPGLI